MRQSSVPPKHAAPRPENADPFALAAARLEAQRPVRKPRLREIVSYLQSNRIELAETALTEFLARYPDDADATNLLARAEARLGRRSRAASLLKHCLELAPDFASARFTYATLLFQLNRFEAALNEVDRLLSEDGRNPLFRQLRAGILGNIGDDEQALGIWLELLSEAPMRAVTWVNCGHAHRAMGHREKSIAAYRKAIELRPYFGLAWWGLANMKTVQLNNDDIAAIQDQLKRTDIGADDRINLLFALGKAYEDQQAFDRSFKHYAKANAAMRLRAEYDWHAAALHLAHEKALFTEEFFRARRDGGCQAPDPIFILGRQRSGSTLIEQILSSHSAVEGTAELPYVAALVHHLREERPGENETDYPYGLEKLEPADLATLGEEYLASARIHRKLGRPCFIDKSPHNYLHLGLILAILPNAKIIDARRNPAACCLSMFKQNFSKTNLRLSELGRVYRDYVDVMAHYDRVLPGRIHRVIYEEMVADPETEIRKLLEYLGLPFEERCLRFYETERAVRTPSSQQVRRPISGEAVDHWRHYEPWLSPLIKSLGSVLTEYPAVPKELR